MALFDFSPESFVQDTISSFFGNPSQAWDRFKNGLANEYNYEVAQDNLNYQKERNAIEDARYENETNYNRIFQEDERAYQREFAENERDYQRAFASNERAYQRALQNQIFEREDTAITRQAEELSKLGINPLSQSMNGLGAGQAVSASSAPPSSMSGSASAPNGSSRGGSALHNDFKMTDQGLLSMVSPLLNMVSGVNDVMTGSKTRDALMSQTDGQILENQSKAIDNLIKASKNDISINDNGTVSLNRGFNKKEQDFNEVEYQDKSATANRNSREDIFQKEHNTHDKESSYGQLITDMAAISGAKGNSDFDHSPAKKATNAISKSIGLAADNTMKGLKALNELRKKAAAKIKEQSKKNKNKDWLPAWQR